MDLWIICAMVGAVLLCAGSFLRLLHRQRSQEIFVAIEAYPLGDISHRPLGGMQPGHDAPPLADAGPLRFRYAWQGQERTGDQGNPWNLPAVPTVRPNGVLTVYYSEARDNAYLDIRTTVIRPLWPTTLGMFLLAIAAAILLL